MSDSVPTKINEVIRDISDIDIQSLKYENKHFFSKDIGLEARDLVAILFAIERQFIISLEENEIQSEYFYNFNGLVNILKAKI